MGTDAETEAPDQLIAALNDTHGWLTEVRKARLKPDLTDTSTLCYLYLITIEQIMRESVGALKAGGVHVSRMAARSILEYVVDLLLIVARNDRDFNRRFAEYHIRTLPFRTHIIDHYRHEIPHLRKQYDDIKLGELAAKASEDTGTGLTIPDWSASDKDAKTRIKIGWTCLNLRERLETLLVESITGPLPLKKAVGIWSDIENGLGIGNADSRATTMTLTERRNRVLTELQMRHSKEATGLRGIPGHVVHLLRAGDKIQAFGSEYVHPSPRSVVPHMDFRTGQWRWEWDFGKEAISDSRVLMFLMLESATTAASPVFGESTGTTLQHLFGKHFICSTEIRNWLSE